MMIVQSDSQVDVSKTTFSPVAPRRGEGSSGEQPPAYQPSMLRDNGYRYEPLYPSSARGERARPRFWRAFCFAVLIFIVINMVVRSIIELAIVKRGGWSGPGSISKDWPEFDRGETQECVDRFSWPYSERTSSGSPSAQAISMQYDASGDSSVPPFSSSASFTLPVDTDLLYFLSRGSLSAGTIRIEADVSPSTDVRVDVEVRYWSELALERATVCTLRRDDGHAHGVGIFTPRNWRNRHPFDSLVFNVRVRIPVALSHAPRTIKALKTALINFRHEIGDTADLLKFGDLRLEGSNGAVTSESAVAENLVVKTNNAAIEGSFSSSRKLKLQTSNAAINTVVHLSADNSMPGHMAEQFTENGRITSAVHLYDTSSSPSNSIWPTASSFFHVRGVSHNGAIDMNVLTHPISSKLLISTLSSNAPISIGLAPAYEGTFSLQSSNARKPLVIDEGAQDPSGRGRRRIIKYDERSGGSNSIFGSAIWEVEPGKQGGTGFTELRTQNAPTTLTFRAQ